MTQVKKKMVHILDKKGGDAIIDAPPGVSCPAVCSVMDSDLIVLVTEPTPFGFHDFRLAWESFSSMGKPMAVVINRAGLGDNSVYRFCEINDLPILASIPYDRAIAQAYSKGQVVAGLNPELRKIFSDLAAAIMGYDREMAHA